jgi:probable phosphoglycerate mutase
MIPLLLIRHGPTDWNAAGRIQGHSDRPLSAAGRRAVRAWRLPDEVTAAAHTWDWLVSPLARARQTLALLTPEVRGSTARVEPALIEMHWGAWEGQRLADLRRADADQVAAIEARGLDFRPPGGESPRDVQARLAPLLAAVAARRRPAIAITHKGVIRAVYARASGWDMTGRPPLRLRESCAHRFLLAADGTPHLDQANISLLADEGAP